MTPEQLMIPRYKVIADYPKSFYTLGEVIECDEPDHQLAQWPAIFKPLQWWQDRKPEELTGYIKLYSNDEWHVYQINILDKNIMRWKFGMISNKEFLPATEAEYTTYINSKK